MKPSEIIDKALTEVIPDESKWGVNFWYDAKTDRHCMSGALNRAAFGVPMIVDKEDVGDYNNWLSSITARRAVTDVIQSMPGNEFDGIMSYNDAHGRTHDEVCAVMEKGRAGLQEKGL